MTSISSTMSARRSPTNVDVPLGDVMRLWIEIEAEPLVSSLLDVGLHRPRASDIEEDASAKGQWQTSQIVAGEGIPIFRQGSFGA
jgi:hypothetical protein